MIFDIGSEIRQTNRAYCAAHGMSSGELYGTAPSQAELETHRLIAAGVPSESATPLFRARKAKHLKHWPRTPMERIGYIEEQIKQGCYQPRGD